jgi:uncharacterized protein (DUF305 family)
MSRTVAVSRLAGLVAAAVLVGAVLGGAVAIAVTRPTAAAPALTPLDIGFAQDMAGHHQQAVTMSDMLAADSAPEVRAVAEQIRFTQLPEIGQLTGWLQLVGAPPSSAHPMEWMHPDHGGMAMTMPGLATPDDLTRLQRSTGRANEVLYLQLMLRHHQGGVDMAAHAARHTSTDAVRRAASVMVDEQTQEIQVMTVLLDQRHSTPLPYP